MDGYKKENLDKIAGAIKKLFGPKKPLKPLKPIQIIRPRKLTKEQKERLKNIEKNDPIVGWLKKQALYAFDVAYDEKSKQLKPITKIKYKNKVFAKIFIDIPEDQEYIDIEFSDGRKVRIPYDPDALFDVLDKERKRVFGK